MTAYKVVVDGSNIATEGRTLPSLNQLDEAVQAFVEEHPGADVLVIVDTSFSHRIDPSEAQVFEAAYEAGEIIMPPAGTIGRGDGFILKVADKLGATVFSNDSFQEFHGTYDWLFDRGRLIGGKPVPGLGWVFMDRTPVRGPKSREAVREAKRSQVRIGSKEAMRPMPVPKAPPAFVSKKVEAAASAPAEGRDGGRRGRRDRRRGRGGREQEVAVAAAPAAKEARPVKEVREGRATREPRQNDRSERPPRPIGEPINDPLAFISFVAEHGIGTRVAGEVDSYSSHGFYVNVAGARGYASLHGLAEPMPRSAKEVVRKGETHSFIVASFDAERRGIQLVLVGSPGAAGIPVADAPASKSRSAKGTGKAVTKAASAGATKKAASKRSPASAKAAPKLVEAGSSAMTVAKPTKTVAKKSPTTEKAGPGKKTASSKAAAPAKTTAKKVPVTAAKVAGTTAKTPVKTTAKTPVKTTAKTPVKTLARTPVKTAAKAAPTKPAPVKTAAKKAPPAKAAPKKVATKKAAAPAKPANPAKTAKRSTAKK